MPVPFLVRNVKNLSYKHPDNFSLNWSHFVEWYSLKKARSVYKKIKLFIIGDKILDVGFGAGTVAKLIVNDGYKMEGIDVVDLSIYKDLKATIYDGKTMPYKNNYFDTAVIVHVLHHCSDPLRVLTEAKRCAKRVIFIEDTYRSNLKKMIVSFNDNIGNWEFWQHQYQTIDDWKITLNKLKVKIVHQSAWSELSPAILPSRYCMFVVE